LQKRGSEQQVYALLLDAFVNEINKGAFKVNKVINYKALINMLFTLNAVVKVINKLCEEFDNV